MQKKYYLAVLTFALVIGMAVAALSQAKAHSDGTSNVYVYIDPHPIAGSSAGVLVNVYIDAPDAWDDTADGIVGWALSVRVDPTVLTVHPIGARKSPPTQASLTGPPPPYPGGFLENYLVRHGHNYYDDMFFMWVVDYPTDFYIGDLDPATGTILDISEIIRGYGTLGLGAGGGPYNLCQLLFVDADGDSTTDPSVIDLFGPPRPLEDPPLKINPMYLTVDGTWHDCVVTDGAYIDETPDKMYFDVGGSGFDPASPIGTDWHELYPTYCQWWTLESWEDNSGEPDGVLDESDQIDLVQIDPATGDTIWGHVDWLNPDPVPGDGKADLIITVKPDVPEYPLGLELIMAFALMTPLIYLWRRKR
jgi:hypothetical protein